MRSYAVEARPEVQELQSSLIRQVANEAMGVANVLPFWFGESDEPTAPFIRNAAIRSIENGETFYSQNLGRPYLREAIARYLGDLHDRPVAVDRIAAVGSGVSAIMLTAQLVVSPGDRVVAVTPLWPNAFEIPKILGARVATVAIESQAGRWTLDLDKLIDALTPDTRLLILNSPNNPTGWTLDDAMRDAILAHCRRHGIWILSDDVYERLVYDPSRKSAPSFLARYEEGDRLMSVNSFAKAWSMTGWRAGWLVVPKSMIGDLTKLIEYNFSCMHEFTQRAATVALEQGEDEVARLRDRLGVSKRVLFDELSALPGVTAPDCGGAMYQFFRIEGYDDTLALAKSLVRDAGLGLAPGGAFGRSGEGWLRWCYAAKPERLSEGVSRLRGFLEGRRLKHG